MGNITDDERFWARVDKTDACWLWTGALNYQSYGIMPLGRRLARQLAHRWSYERFVGPIPDGMEIDHACHVPAFCQPQQPRECPHRRCVNPEHLRVATRLENVRNSNAGQPRAAQQKAKTHCPHRHPYDEANTALYWHTAGHWQRCCRICNREKNRVQRERRRAALEARAKILD